MWWSAVCLLVLTVCKGGLTKQPASGITQFWTDDYKVFDKVYGKTSDKDLYGATLPPAYSYGVDTSKTVQNEASEKKERYLEQQQNPDFQQDLDPYAYGARSYGLLTNQALKNFVAKTPKKSSTKFIASDFKPIISKDSDPETYNYLKHLEFITKQKEQFSPGNTGNLKPHLKYGGGSSEETEGYKSIQDILEAHEANKGKGVDNDDADEQVKYLSHAGHKNRIKIKKGKLTAPIKGSYRCPSGRCRKRATTSYRGRTYLTRPILRKIKTKIIRY